MRTAASPGIMPRLTAGAAACADQVWHSSNDCPKQQKSSVIPASPASSRTPLRTLSFHSQPRGIPLLVVGAGSDTPGTALLGTNGSCPVFVPPLELPGELLLDGPVVQGAGPSVQVEELATVDRGSEFG
ncbi:hypothetical protein VC83_01649 [Pseudogymnoascus destructans]|uniref:Uncharacterized protein n=2 Tax=Pseudogymnoascus destructans TaxID=655981 RepID=L8FQW4_PSED2|nr:uncharacterized protein VC83_01649 [Pseudogymnoascus destructans]ELR03370.1 hypothetical protein GMDG_06113 [Pseudogymnoascus destructans 20631-21]OAF61870.1 hypothetical protein VC83_01649 [Pseudogymnoascus destructans]